MADVNKLKNQARREEQRENWSRAIDLYTRALEGSLSNPRSTPDLSLYNRIGDIHMRLGDEEKAVSYYEEAISHYAADDLHTSAIALCNKVLRILPGRVGIFRRLGRLHAATGLVAEARVNYLRYVSSMDEEGREEEALEALHECVDHTADAEAALRLTDRLVDAGEVDEAVERLRGVVEVAGEAGRPVPELEARLASLAEAAAREAATAPERSEEDAPAETVLRALEVELSGGASAAEGPEPPEDAYGPVDGGAPPRPHPRTSRAGAGSAAGPPPAAGPPSDTMPGPAEKPAPEAASDETPGAGDVAGDEAAGATPAEPLEAEPGAPGEPAAERPAADDEPEEGARERPPLRRLTPDLPEVAARPVSRGVGESPRADSVEPARRGPRIGGRIPVTPRAEGAEAVAHPRGPIRHRRASRGEPPERRVVPSGRIDRPQAASERSERLVAAPLPPATPAGRPEAAERPLTIPRASAARASVPGEPAEGPTWASGAIAARPSVAERVEGPAAVVDARPPGRRPRPEPREASTEDELGLAELLSSSRWRVGRDAVRDVEDTGVGEEPARQLFPDAGGAGGARTNGGATSHPPDDAAGPFRVRRFAPAAAVAEPSLSARDIRLPLSGGPDAERREPALRGVGVGRAAGERATRDRAEVGEGATFGSALAAPFVAGAEPAEALVPVHTAEIVAGCRRAVEAARTSAASAPEAVAAPVEAAAAPEAGGAPTSDGGPGAEKPAAAAPARVTSAGDVPAAEASEPSDVDARAPAARAEAGRRAVGEVSEPPVEPPLDAEQLARAAADVRGSTGDLRPATGAPGRPEGAAGPPAAPDASAGGAPGGRDPVESERREPDSAFREWVRSAPAELLHDTREELERRDEIRKALLVVDRLLDLDSGDPWLHRKRVAYARELEDAEVLPRAVLALGASLQACGERREAREAYTELLGTDPHNEAARAALEALEQAEVQEETRVREETPVREEEREDCTKEDGPSAGLRDGERSASIGPRARSGPSVAPGADGPDPARSTAGSPRGGDPSIPRVGSPGPTPYDRIADSGEADFEKLLNELRTQLVERDPSPDARTRTELGAELKEMGLLDDAIRELQAAVREPNASPQAFELLGEAFIEKGQPRVAARLLASTLEGGGHSDRQLLGVLYQLGIAYEQVDDPHAALDCYERIFSVNIDYRDVQQRIRACTA